MAQEARTQAGIIDFARGQGAWVVKMHQSGRTQKGVADLLMCFEGRCITLEVKAPAGRPTTLQLNQLRQVQRAGGVAAIVRSVDEVRVIFDAIRAAGPLPPLPQGAIPQPRVVQLFADGPVPTGPVPIAA